MSDSVEVKAGHTVYLLDRAGKLISDDSGIPILYQVTSVYRDFRKVGLVTYYGEYIGTHSIDYVVYISSEPFFKKEDYTIGSTVIWVDNEDVYEGTITSLGESTAKLENIRKLLPINHTVRIPYWKIPDGRKVEITSKIMHHDEDDYNLGGD